MTAPGRSRTRCSRAERPRPRGRHATPPLLATRDLVDGRAGSGRVPLRRLSKAALWVAAALSIATSAPSIARADVVLAPGPSGGIGALLVAGPLLARPAQKRPQLAVDFALPTGRGEGDAFARAKEKLDATGREAWQVVASASGALDLKTALKTQGSEVTALAAAVLRVSTPFEGYLSLGTDDGAAVYLDGQRVLARDDSRGSFEDDELIPLSLAPGDHPLLLKLHPRGGSFVLRLRLVDRELGAARGVSVVLAGDIDAGALLGELADVRLDRGLVATGLAPRLDLRFPGGWPRDVARDVTAVARVAGRPEALFDVRAGRVPLSPDGPVSDLDVFLPQLSASDLAGPEAGGELTFDVQVGPLQRSFTALPRAGLREALAAAEKARIVAAAQPPFLRDADTVVASLEHLSDRLRLYAGRGDTDVAAQLEEASRLRELAEAVLHEQDPLYTLRGARRLAYRSPYDGRPSPFGLYVPEAPIPEGKKLPLVAALHGLNGKPLNMMRWFFGRDDGGHDGEWEDRHPGAFPAIDGIVVTPMANFNAGYRYASEDDVINVVRWARRMFPVDPDRVSITGPSMGGTGTAAVAFRYAGEFASAAPLCGYHSYALRGDMAGRTKRPWEVHIAEERSTISWAPNGLHLPLMIVHGTRDLPVENSGVLIDRYKGLGYAFTEDHPDEGHNVWQPTYEDMKGFQWLSQFRRPAHPTRIVFRTDDLRYDRYAWLRVARLERSEAWADVRADVSRKGKTPRVKLVTSNVGAFELERDEKVLPKGQPVVVDVDGTSLSFDESEPLKLERQGGVWQKGISEPAPGLRKSRGLAGPIRDVFHEPVIAVYGTLDPRLRRANEEVARVFAAIKPGFDIEYPIVADVDLDPSRMASHSLVLVGGRDSNAITRALDDRLPIHVTSDPPAVTSATATWSGEQTGAIFIHPNPDHPGRYVVVLAGTTVTSTLRALSLPDLLPDFLVWDERLARARGQMVLGAAAVRAAGLFDESWKLPDVTDDPVKPKTR